MSAPTTRGRPPVDEGADPARGWRRLLRRVVPAVLGLVALALLASQHAPAAGLPAPTGGPVLRGTAAWVVTAAVGGLAVVLLAVGLFAPPAAWRYPDVSRRDERIDLLRGLAVVFVVLNHVNLPSLPQTLSQEAVGVVSGAELFVALSGVVLGLVYRPRVERTDVLDAAGALWRRAFLLYRTALLVIVTVFLLSLVPGVDGRVLTTFSDQSTGQTYGLYANVERLLDYPVPGWVLQDVLLLQLGPWQFNVIGLYVVLLAVAPLMLSALQRGLVLPLLAGSGALYLWNLVHETRVLPSQFEDPFPLLSWQVLFVGGLAAGWHRGALLRWAGRPTGRAVVALCVVAHLALVFFSWNNPATAHAYDPRLAVVPEPAFQALYAQWFERRLLEPGRLLDVVLTLVTGYALLTVYWRPVSRVVGWLLVPLGRASLYVFVVHVYAALLVANVPGLDRGDVLLGTVAHVVVLAALWGMVRTRLLFRYLPH